jgi:hypothetical protein
MPDYQRLVQCTQEHVAFSARVLCLKSLKVWCRRSIFSCAQARARALRSFHGSGFSHAQSLRKTHFQESAAHETASRLETERRNNVEKHQALHDNVQEAFQGRLAEVAKPQSFTGI